MEPGKYRGMMPRTLTTYWWYRSHGRDEQVTDFVLSEVAPEEVERLNRHHAAVNGFRKACRETLRARDPQGSVPDSDALMWLAHSRFAMDRWSSVATGDRGWLIAGECFGRVSLMTAMPFSHGYEHAMGVNSAWRPNLGWVVPQAVYRTIFSDAGAIMQSYGRGGGPLGMDLWARGFGLVPDDLKPMSLWGWKRTQALADAGKLKAPEIGTHDDSIGKFEVNYWKEHRYAAFTRRIVNVGGGDRTIVAMTLQKGETPKVTASVEDESVEIRIGARVVTFDGNRLNLAGK